MFCDAHFHLVQCFSHKIAITVLSETVYACCCSHCKDDFFIQERLSSDTTKSPLACKILPAFGVHPQMLDAANMDFLEQLLIGNRILAIGEAGFDLSSEKYRQTVQLQEEAWDAQLQLAKYYGKPLVVHCVKAIDRLFKSSNMLKQLPAVIFHSFSGSFLEAQSLLNRNINCFFSFGKHIFSGGRSALCVSHIPLQCLLFETDAPYQTLRGETATSPNEIKRVYREAQRIRGENDNVAFEEAIMHNFESAFLDCQVANIALKV